MEQWTLTSYKLPSDNELVLVSVRTENSFGYDLARFDKNTSSWAPNKGTFSANQEIIGWMKLPGILIK